MSFSDETKAALGAKLHPSSVKSRQQGGASVSYIEGWHVIDEANRIFGFDAWTRETLDIRCVAEKDRKIGVKENFAGYDGFGVSYLCKVRVIVDGVAREGCGAGHGIDRDLGQAHESAIKEAETDAMKRAFMTFGNPFGLALYDKTRASVGEDGPPPVDALTKNAFMVECREVIDGYTDANALAEWWQSENQKTARRNKQLDQSQVDALKQAVIQKRETLIKKAA